MRLLRLLPLLLALLPLPAAAGEGAADGAGVHARGVETDPPDAWAASPGLISGESCEARGRDPRTRGEGAAPARALGPGAGAPSISAAAPRAPAGCVPLCQRLPYDATAPPPAG